MVKNRCIKTYGILWNNSILIITKKLLLKIQLPFTYEMVNS